MDSDRWEQIDRLLQSVLDRPPDDREAFLRESCSGDEALEREVRSLLASHQEADSFLERPAIEVTAEAIASQQRTEPVPCLTGRTISHYRILEKLGTGGMGVVWKALDPHLDRFVAFKVLPPARMDDPECRRRFAQEARAVSALNHPNIVGIYDVSRSDGADFIVMEFVEGEALDRLIPQKGLRVKEALTYAIQIADAVSAAHAAGIIHRDLKPGNIVVKKNGQVKVLDFGLAKLIEQCEVIEKDTTTGAPQTDEGMILGTLSYMSPEQAEGKQVDARSDIFSFGAMLYEMLTGKRAFPGDSRMSVIAALLHREPEPAEALVSGIPRELGRILQRCLRKDPERRAHSMADLRLALQEIKEEFASGAPAAVADAKPPNRPKARRAAAAVTVFLALGGAALWLARRSQLPEAVLQAVPLTAYPGFESYPAFSPDGKQIAFSWDGEGVNNYDIYVKLLGSVKPLRLTSDPAEDASPCWSPDGQTIAFVRHDEDTVKLMAIPALGGPERQIAELMDSSTDVAQVTANWSPDGRWLLIAGKSSVEKPSALWLVSVETGEKHQLTIPPASTLGDYYGAFSPDGTEVAFVRCTGLMACDLYLLPLAGDLGKPIRLTTDNRTIYGIAWTGDAREIVFSSDRGAARGLWKVRASGSGDPRPLTVGENGILPAISRQGNRLVYSQRITDSNIWRANLSDPGSPTELIASTRFDGSPQYSPDGRKIAFVSNRTGNREVWVCDSDGSNPSQLVNTGQSGSPRWSPDSRTIAFDSNTGGNWHIYTVSGQGGRPHRLTSGAANDTRPSWSHDGKWIYFGSNRSKQWQIWKIPANGGAALQVTRLGGYNPIESPDGRTIYYAKNESLKFSPVWNVPAAGGEESQVLEAVFFDAFAPARSGIYFISPPNLEYYSFSTGVSKSILALEKRTGLGLTVSPDEHWLLYNQVDRGGSDLMLVENFR